MIKFIKNLFGFGQVAPVAVVVPAPYKVEVVPTVSDTAVATAIVLAAKITAKAKPAVKKPATKKQQFVKKPKATKPASK